jgi:hypothetical protein
MHRLRRISLLALGLATTSACLITGGAAAAPQKCVLELRVNVFATSPGGNWALQGALNAGSLAHLRAKASGGCTVDHIRGRWISGPTTAIAPKQCGGPPPCVWKVRGNRQSAAAFQAFSGPSGSSTKSNVVRVAWAGSCTRIGGWLNETEGIGVPQTTWTVEAGGAAREVGGGTATGMAVLNGHVLRIVWVASDQVTAGVYEWTLGPNCTKGQGSLRFTGPPARVGPSFTSKVTKVG